MHEDNRFVSFLVRWHGLWRHRHGLEGLRRSIRQIQGVDVPVSDLEHAVLGSRVADYAPVQLDALLGAGEVVWQGRQPTGQHDGLLTLFRKRDFPSLGRISVFVPGAREGQIRNLLLESGGLEFEEICGRLGGFPDEILRSLWRLAWNGEVTSNSLDALRSRLSSTATRYHPRPRPRYAARRRIPPGSAGRWILLCGPGAGFAPEAERESALVRQLLDRYGIIPADSPVLEGRRSLPALEQLEKEGEARRTRLPGWGGAVRFAAPGAEAVWREAGEHPAVGMLPACDPANPFGALIPWPGMMNGHRPQRVPGARVLIEGGRLVAYLARGGRAIHTPSGAVDATVVIRLLKRSVGGRPLFLELINGESPYATPWHGELVEAGFSPSSRGYLLRAS